MAHWCHHGWYPRTIRARKTAQWRPAGAYPQWWDYSQISTKYQAVSELCAGAVATGWSIADNGIDSFVFKINLSACKNNEILWQTLGFQIYSPGWPGEVVFEVTDIKYISAWHSYIQTSINNINKTTNAFVQLNKYTKILNLNLSWHVYIHIVSYHHLHNRINELHQLPSQGFSVTMEIALRSLSPSRQWLDGLSRG